MRITDSVLLTLLLAAAAMGQTIVNFDFDNAPPYTPLPINVVSGGVTAHLSGGYSIQNISAVPVQPIGFSGRLIYPSSVYLADLSISFDKTLTAFSIGYSPQELGCDDSARMRVTAYFDATFVGTQTAICPNPGTWPVWTLAGAFPQGFNNVVVHYDAHPPTCQDYGVIFIADNMSITVPTQAAVASVGTGCGAGATVFSSTVPRIGHNVVLSLTQASPNASGYVYYSAVPPGPIPIGSGCFVYIDLATFLPLLPVATNASGAWSATVPLPLDQLLVGRTALMQVALFATAGPLGFDASNGVLVTLGY